MMARKGISPLIAVVLLVVFTVGISVVISSWLSSYARQTTEQARGVTEQAVQCAQAVIDITGADDNGVFVANIGAVDINITKIYVYDNQTNRCDLDVNEKLEVGEERYFRYTDYGGLADCPGDLASVRVTTNCPGVIDEYAY